MRAIIIDDKDARALVDNLALANLRKKFPKSLEGETPSADEIHRVFHYVVVSWLQDQGARLH